MPAPNSLRSAAYELDGIRNEMASMAEYDHDEMVRRVDDVGHWLATQQAVKLTMKLLHEAHKIRERLGV